MAASEAEEHNQRGNDAFNDRKTEDAVAHYTAAIKAAPQVPKYYSNRSFANIQLKKYDDALKDGLRAVELDPTSDKFRTRVIAALAHMGNVSQAQVELAKFQKDFPKSEFAAGLETLLQDAEVKRERAKKADKAKYPIPEPPLDAELPAPETWFTYGLRSETMAFKWFVPFDDYGLDAPKGVCSDRRIEAHKFFIDSFTLGCIETKEHILAPPPTYAYAMQAHRMSLLPKWWSFDVLMRITRERQTTVRTKEQIRTYWRESAFHSQHVLLALRTLRESILSPQLMPLSEKTVAEAPDIEPHEVPPMKPGAICFDVAALEHARHKELALPVMKEFQRRYAAAKDPTEAFAAIDITVALLTTFVENHRDGIVETSAFLCLVHWRCAEHAVYWYTRALVQHCPIDRAVWAWAHALGAYGWNLTPTTAPALLAFFAAVYPPHRPEDLPHTAAVAALSAFMEGVKGHLRQNAEPKALLSHVRARPEDFHVRPSAVNEVHDKLP
jgi:hypothetical protein